MLALALDDATTAAAPTFVDFDDRAISIQIDRGRPDEWSKPDGGTCRIHAQNRDGELDPTNTGGSNYGHILPLAEGRIQMANPITGGDPVPVFTGYIDDYAFERIAVNGFTADVDMIDLQEWIAQADANTSSNPRVWGAAYAAQHVDDRLKALLADAGVPAAKTRIATGNVDVMPAIYESGDKIIQGIDDATDAEFPHVANRFVDKEGLFAFSGRGIRFDPDTYPDWVTTWRVGDAAALAVDDDRLPILKDSIRWTWGKANLYNDAVVAPEGASAAQINANHVVDAASKTQYGKRSLPPILGLLVYRGTTSGNDAWDECLDYATYFVNNYKVPRDRITAISFSGPMDGGGSTPGGAAGSLWDFILNVEINHIVNVKCSNPGGGGIGFGDGSGDGVDYFVEGIHHSISNLNDVMPRWTMTLDLSPRARFATYP